MPNIICADTTLYTFQVIQKPDRGYDSAEISFDLFLSGMTFDEIVPALGNSDAVPSVVGKLLTHPNPYSWSSGSGQIGYRLNKATNLEIRLYNMAGHQIFSKQIEEDRDGGRFGYNWISFGSNELSFTPSTGVYMVLLLHDGNVIAKTKWGIKR